MWYDDGSSISDLRTDLLKAGLDYVLVSCDLEIVQLRSHLLEETLEKTRKADERSIVQQDHPNVGHAI